MSLLITFLILVPDYCDAKDVALVYEIPFRAPNAVYAKKKSAINEQIEAVRNLMTQITTDETFLKECDQFSFNLQDETSLQYVKPFKCKNDQPCFQEAHRRFNESKDKFPYTRRE